MSRLTLLSAALLTFALTIGCEMDNNPPTEPANDVDTVNDPGTGNAPNTGTGEPSAAE